MVFFTKLSSTILNLKDFEKFIKSISDVLLHPVTCFSQVLCNKKYPGNFITLGLKREILGNVNYLHLPVCIEWHSCSDWYITCLVYK